MGPIAHGSTAIACEWAPLAGETSVVETDMLVLPYQIIADAEPNRSESTHTRQSQLERAVMTSFFLPLHLRATRGTADVLLLQAVAAVQAGPGGARRGHQGELPLSRHQHLREGRLPHCLYLSLLAFPTNDLVLDPFVSADPSSDPQYLFASVQ